MSISTDGFERVCARFRRLTPAVRMIAACGAWGCALTAGLLLFPPSGLEAASARLGALSESSAEPFSQQGGKLTGSNEIGAGFFGYTVALSADGTTALVGGFADDAGKGAAWVFTRSGSTWNQQGPKLTGGGEIGAGAFGSSVALSADGTTALIGGTYDDNSGAAWVFTRAGSTWSQQGGKFTGSGEARGGFGSSVALSGDGATALIGASNGKGAAWAFGYAGSTWSRQGKLTGRGGVGSGALGSSVALSADGETALIGGQNDGANQGAAWVFGRSGSTWSPQGGKLTGRGETGKGQFGSGLALSADGGTALIGGLWDDNSKGAAWLFCRSGSTWNRQGSKLTGRGETIHSEFGFSVALSADGSTALIAGPGNHPGTSTYDGAVWVFTSHGAASSRGGVTWTQEQLQERTVGGQFGAGVALSADGRTALIGSPGGAAARAFTFTAPATSAGHPPAVSAGPPSSTFKPGFQLCKLASLAAIGKAAGKSYSRATDAGGGDCYWLSTTGDEALLVTAHPVLAIENPLLSIGKHPGHRDVKPFSVPGASKAVMETYNVYALTLRYHKTLHAAYPNGLIEVDMVSPSALPDASLVAVMRLVTSTKR